MPHSVWANSGAICLVGISRLNSNTLPSRAQCWAIWRQQELFPIPGRAEMMMSSPGLARPNRRSQSGHGKLIPMSLSVYVPACTRSTNCMAESAASANVSCFWPSWCFVMRLFTSITKPSTLPLWASVFSAIREQVACSSRIT